MSRTRSDLHRVAAHILGRRRFQVSGHFGLRASPAGIATPAFGSDPEVLRVAGLNLVREVGTQCRTIPLSGSTLTQLAAFVDADLGAEFSAGANAPALGPVDAPLDLDADELDAVFQWFDLAWRVLDGIADAAVLGTGWATIQLWPRSVSSCSGPALMRSWPVRVSASPVEATSATS